MGGLKSGQLRTGLLQDGLKTGKLRSGLRNVGVGFAPNHIDSLAHWYDATEISGSDGDAIGTWTDQEGTDDLTQSTSSAKPTLKTNQINNNNVLRGDKTDDLMDVDWTDIGEPFQIFGAVKYLASGTSDTWVDGLTANEGRFEDWDTNEWAIYQGSSVIHGGTVNLNAHIWTGLFRSGTNNDVLRIDGTQEAAGDSGNSSLTGLTVFARGDGAQLANADIGEVLVYDTELSTSDRDSVESYLGDKWGVTI